VLQRWLWPPLWFSAAGIMAGQGTAAPTGKAYKASHPRIAADFKRPRLRHGVLTVEGTEASDRIALRLQRGSAGILQVDVGDDGSADFSFVRERVTSIAVDAGAGNDLVRIDDGNGAFTNTIPTTIAGRDGNDFLLGGAGAERLVGGPGIDSIDGNGGNDLAIMGAGDDVFVWDPGDGSDTVEGRDGTDTMLFNGAGGDERVDLSANGNRLRFFRDPGRVTMDTAGVERVDFSALGGADLVTVNDLHGTDVSAVDLDLGLDGSGDGQDDQVTVNGTVGNDTLDVRGDASRVIVSGGRALVSIVDHEPTDRLVVNGLDGNDALSATGLAAGAIALTLDVNALPRRQVTDDKLHPLALGVPEEQDFVRPAQPLGELSSRRAHAFTRCGRQAVVVGDGSCSAGGSVSNRPRSSCLPARAAFAFPLRVLLARKSWFSRAISRWMDGCKYMSNPRTQFCFSCSRTPVNGVYSRAVSLSPARVRSVDRFSASKGRLHLTPLSRLPS
jgi:hypothetical protein